jgi:hypothetical protein
VERDICLTGIHQYRIVSLRNPRIMSTHDGHPESLPSGSGSYGLRRRVSPYGSLHVDLNSKCNSIYSKGQRQCNDHVSAMINKVQDLEEEVDARDTFSLISTGNIPKIS